MGSALEGGRPEGRYPGCIMQKHRSQALVELEWDLPRGLSKNMLSLGEREADPRESWKLTTGSELPNCHAMHIAVPHCCAVNRLQGASGYYGHNSLTVFCTIIQKFIVVEMIFEYYLNGSLCKLNSVIILDQKALGVVLVAWRFSVVSTSYCTYPWH